MTDETEARPTPPTASGAPSGGGVPPLHPDGTVCLPADVEVWLDGHFAGEKDDDARELDAGRNTVAVALWSLINRQGDPDDDQAALDAIVSAAASFGEPT